MSVATLRTAGYSTKGCTCPDCGSRVEYTDVEVCTGANHDGEPEYRYVSGYFCMYENCEHYHEPIDPEQYRYEN